MYSYLHKYFAQHRKLAIPGIGSFSVETIPAQLDFTEKTLHAPLPEIKFSEETSPADKRFFDFLSAELNTDEVTAIRKFTDFAAGTKAKLDTDKSITIPGLGTLAKHFANTYTFTPENHLHSFLPDVYAERVMRKNAEHTIRVGEEEKTSTQMQELLYEKPLKKDLWWVYAIVLAVIGIAVIMVYYAIR